MNLKKILRIITFASNRRHRWVAQNLIYYRLYPNWLTIRRLQRELKGKED